MFLRHRRLRSVENILNQRGSIRQFNFAAFDIPHVLLVDKEQVITSFASDNVDVLSQLHITVGAEDGKTSVSPGLQPFWRKPVDAEISRSTIAPYGSVSEIFEPRIL